MSFAVFAAPPEQKQGAEKAPANVEEARARAERGLPGRPVAVLRVS